MGRNNGKAVKILFGKVKGNNRAHIPRGKISFSRGKLPGLCFGELGKPCAGQQPSCRFHRMKGGRAALNKIK